MNAAVLQRVAAAMEKARFLLRQLCPKDTGNMAYNAVKLESIGEGHWRLYVDERVAPYVPYTNEPWVSPYWNGKRNPNAGWFDSAAQQILAMLAVELKGEIKNG